MPNTRPFVAAACICDNVIIEPDGVATLVRIVDTYTLEMPAGLPENIKGEIDIVMFLSLKSGDITGQHRVRVQLRRPDGSLGPPNAWNVVLNGGVHGANLKVKMIVRDPKEGLNWFDVFWNDEPEVLTSIPMVIKLMQQTGTPSSAPAT